MSQTDEQYVVFVIHHSLYGVSIQEVSEIIRMRTVNWLPNSREEFLGMIQLRDKMIPVISLHRIFSEAEKELNAKTRIIVIHSGGQEIGIVVDEVNRVAFLSPQRIGAPPHMSQNEWMTGVYHDRDTIIALLNVEALLGHREVKSKIKNGVSACEMVF